MLQDVELTPGGCYPHNLTPQPTEMNQIVKLISSNLGTASAD